MNKKGNIRTNCPKQKGKGKAMDNSSSNDTTNVVEDISDYNADNAFSVIAGGICTRMNGFWIWVVHVMSPNRGSFVTYKEINGASVLMGIKITCKTVGIGTRCMMELL